MHKTWIPGNIQYNNSMKPKNPVSVTTQPIVPNVFSGMRFGIMWATVVTHEQNPMTGDGRLRNDGVRVSNWRPPVDFMGDCQ